MIVIGSFRTRAWIAGDGGERSTLEILAEEIGPSLRWATAEVTTQHLTDPQPAGPTSSGAGRRARQSEPVPAACGRRWNALTGVPDSELYHVPGMAQSRSRSDLLINYWSSC